MRDSRVALTIVTMTLISVGIVMIYSASCVNAMETFHDSLYYLKRHLLFLGMGLLSAYVVMSVDYHHIQPYARRILIVSIVLLDEPMHST